RDEEALGIVGMAHADVAVGIDHVLLGEDAVGDDEVLDEVVEIGHELISAITDEGVMGRSIYRSFPRKRESRTICAELGGLGALLRGDERSGEPEHDYPCPLIGQNSSSSVGFQSVRCWSCRYCTSVFRVVRFGSTP